MAGATLTTLSNILKEFYLPPVVEQLNNEVLLLQRLEPRSEELFGKQAIVPVHKTRSGGIGTAVEGGALPAAGNQAYDRAVYDLKYLYGRIRVTGPSMAKTASEAGAFLQSLKSELDGIRNDLKKDLARQVYGSKFGNGFIAKCGVTSAATVVVLSDAESVRKGHLHIGMLVDITDNTGAAIANGTARTITDVSVANGTITIADGGGNVTTAATHFVSRSGNALKEITGLQEIISDTAGGTVGGINSGAAGNSYWDNMRLMNAGTGRAVSVTLLGQARSQARVSGGDPSLAVTTFGLERQVYETVFQGSVRYIDTTEFKGGYKALDWQGLPLVGDVDAPFGKIHFVTEKQLKVFSPQDWHFLDEDGDVLKWVVGFDMWESVLARYINIGATRRNTQMVLGDLNDATGV
jgi:hypothetical protein